MENVNLIKIIGRNKQNGETCVAFTYANQSFMEKLTNKIVWLYRAIVNCNEIATFDIIVKEWSIATQVEKRQVEDFLRQNNLVYETRKCLGNNIHGDYVNNVEGYFYISKEKLKVIIDGKEFNFQNLPNFEEGTNVVLSGDNGYSHWWSETISANRIVNYIHVLFDERNNGLARFGEHCGWEHDRCGALIVRTTKNCIRNSVVSNT